MLKKLFAVMMVVGFVAAVLVSPVLADDQTITGTVVQNGDELSIKTDSGDIMVGKEGKGAELMNEVNKKVEVTGAVQESDGKKTINVTDYKVVE